MLEIPSRGMKLNGSSLIVYKTQFRRPIEQMTLNTVFNARDVDGVILFASRYSNGSGPHLFLQMNAGSVEFGLSTGTHSTVLRYVNGL